MDAIEGMSRLPDKSVDMVLCDLPYGTTRCKWDVVIPFDKLWQPYERVTKPNAAIVLFGKEPFSSSVVRSNVDGFKYRWVWVKNNATGHLNAHKQPMRLCEDIMVFCADTYNPQGLIPFNKKVRRGHNGENFGSSGTENLQQFTNYPTDVLCFNYDTPKLHPTQKPIALCEYLIKTYTNPGALVLDHCAGSGTTGIACINTDRNFILFENDPQHFKTASDRILAHQLG